MGRASYSYLAVLSFVFVTSAYALPSGNLEKGSPDLGIQGEKLNEERDLAAKPALLQLVTPQLTLLVGSSPSILVNESEAEGNESNANATAKIVPSVLLISAKDKDKDLLLIPVSNTSKVLVTEKEAKPIASLRSAEIDSLEETARLEKISKPSSPDVSKIVANSMKQATANLNLGDLIPKLRSPESFGELSLFDLDREFREIPLSPPPPTIHSTAKNLTHLPVNKTRELHTRDEPSPDDGAKESTAAPTTESTPTTASPIQAPIALDGNSANSKPKLVVGPTKEPSAESTSLPPVTPSTLAPGPTTAIPLESTTAGLVPHGGSSTVSSIGFNVSSTSAPPGLNVTTTKPGNITTPLPGRPGVPKPVPTVIPGLPGLSPGIVSKIPADVLQNLNLPPIPPRLPGVPGNIPKRPEFQGPAIPPKMQGSLVSIPSKIPAGIPERPGKLPSGLPNLQNLPSSLPPALPERIPKPAIMRPPVPPTESLPGIPNRLPSGYPPRPAQLPQWPANVPSGGVPPGSENLRLPQFPERPANLPNVPSQLPQNIPIQPQNIPNIPQSNIPGRFPQEPPGLGRPLLLGAQNAGVQPPQGNFIPSQFQGEPNFRPGNVPGGPPQGRPMQEEFPGPGVPSVPSPPRPQENLNPSPQQGGQQQGQYPNPQNLGQAPPGSFADYYAQPQWTPQHYIQETYPVFDDMPTFRMVPVKRDELMQAFRPSTRGEYLWRLVEREVVPIEAEFYRQSSESGQERYNFRSYYTPSFRTPSFYQ